jgi:hypothetical protein
MTVAPVGVTLEVRSKMVWDYPHSALAELAPGWEREWFYIHNNIDGPMPKFAMLPPSSLPPHPWSCPKEDLAWVDGLIGIIWSRVRAGLTCMGVTCAFLQCRV